MFDTIFVIRDGLWIQGPGCYIIQIDGLKCTINGRQAILRQIRVVSPASELVSIMKCDYQFNALSAYCQLLLQTRGGRKPRDLVSVIN